MKKMFFLLAVLWSAIHVVSGQTPLAEGYARIILKVEAGSPGAQMLLDAQANTYRTLVPNSQMVLSYRLFDYKIPANAERNPATKNKIINGSGSVDIPAGTYDCYVTIPSTSRLDMAFAGQGKSFAAGKTYEISVSADNNVYEKIISGTADPHYENCVLTTFPLWESFEDETDFQCWKTYSITGNYQWERLSAALNTSPQTIRSGQQVMRVINLSAEKQDAYLVSPKIKIPASGTILLSFWSKMLSVSVYGKSSVWITKSDNPDPKTANYEQLWQAQSPQENVWTETGLLLDQYKGENVYIAFRNEGNDWSHLWYLDDLSLAKLKDKDAGVTAITAPQSGSRLSAAETVSIKVKNFGSQEINNLSVFLQVNNGTVIEETIPGTIAALKETVYTFTKKINLSAEGIYDLKVYTAFNGDENPENDAKTVQVSNYGECKITAFPYTYGFENRDSLNCWTVIYPGPRNVPDIEGTDIATPYSGEHFWRFISFYGNGSGDRYYEQYLISPELDTAEPKVFEFYYRTDGVDSYVADEFFSVGYSTTDKQPASFTWISDVTANKREWKKQSDIIPADARYIAVKYHKFNFFLYIDDITIRILPPSIDAGVTKIVSPVRGNTEPVPVTVTIQNFGGTTINSMDVVYELMDNEPVVEHYENATGIAPATSIDYTFSDVHKANVSVFRDDYRLKAYVRVNGDLDHSNDTASVAFLYRPNVRLYGYRYWDDLLFQQYIDAHAPVFFDSGDLTNVGKINNYKDESNDITAVEYVNDTLYAFSTAMGYPANFIRLTSDWQELSKTEAQELVWALSYDYSTNTMYGITGNRLLKIDLKTGTPATIAPVRRFYMMACTLEGQLYGVDENSYFCAIDKRTGAVRQIGKTGMTVTSALQSMTFDHRSGRLFWAMPYEGRKENGNYDSQGWLCEINVATGVATRLGSINGEGQARLAGLYIPYHPDDVAIRQPEAGKTSTISVYPNPSKGKIRISSVPENAVIRILDLSGRMCGTYTGSGNVDLNLDLPKGVYFVRIETKNEKVIRKLILQ